MLELRVRAGRPCLWVEPWEEGLRPEFWPKHPTGQSCRPGSWGRLWVEQFGEENQEVRLEMLHLRTT